jgi:7-cyano-7-deazaguanine synthase
MIERLLSAVVFDGRLTPLASVAFTMRDVYSASHWAITGTPPAYDTPDEAVYLAGRNLVLLTKAGVVAASRRLARIALGTLADNPFPDATPQFFTTISRALSLGLNYPMEVVTPFSAMHKEDVIRIGVALGVPLGYTLSCMSPVVNGDLPVHCGLCSKCRERRDAFALAGVDDSAPYAGRSPR